MNFIMTWAEFKKIISRRYMKKIIFFIFEFKIKLKKLKEKE